MDKKNQQKINFIFKILGIIVFLLILKKIDFNNLKTQFKNINYIKIIYGIVFLFLYHILKSYRWKLLLSFQNIKIKLFNCYCMYIKGLYLGLVTPGRIGDFVKIIYLKNRNVDVIKSSVNVIIDRIIDMVFMLFFSSIVLIYFFLTIKLSLKISLLILFFYTVIFFIFIIKIFPFLFKKIIFKLPLDKIKKGLKTKSNEFINEFSKIKKKQWLILSISTPFIWFFYFTVIYFFIIAVNPKFSYFNTLFSFLISTLITFLPISFMGIGWREIVLYNIFPKIGASQTDVIIFSFSMMLGYLLVAIIGLGISLFYND